MSTAITVKLWNESALGIYQMCWKSKTGGRCEVAWYEGLGEPRFSFYSTTRGGMTPPVPIRNPGRFGWAEPRKLADFKAFVLRYAEACESDN
jgi:hypothetical protein